MNNCDCTSLCGDDPDLRKGTVKPCDTYLERTEPKRLLIGGLKRQAALMRANANYLEQLYPALEHHLELRGAALITQNWIDKIQKINTNGVAK